MRALAGSLEGVTNVYNTYWISLSDWLTESSESLGDTYANGLNVTAREASSRPRTRRQRAIRRRRA